MASIDLLPPPDWLDDYPLFRKPIKDLNRSFEWALQLPGSQDEFQKELGFDNDTVAKFREDIELIVQVYNDFRGRATNYRENILGAMISLSRTLNSHASSVESYYGALFEAIDDYNVYETKRQQEKKKESKNADENEAADGLDWAKMVMDLVVNKVTSQMTHLSDGAQAIVKDVEELVTQIGGYRTTVDKNLSRLRSRKASSQKGEEAKHRDEASYAEVIELQNVLFGVALDEVLKNITETIKIINTMQGQFQSISNTFVLIKTKTLAKELPSFAPDSQKTVFKQWNAMCTITSKQFS